MMLFLGNESNVGMLQGLRDLTEVEDGQKGFHYGWAHNVLVELK